MPGNPTNPQTESISRRRHIMHFLKPREPVNAFTHFLGALLSIPGLICLLRQIPENSDARYYAAVYVFGISLLLLYFTSGFYHLVSGSAKTIALLRRVDHMMIYILIAGTYTPVCLLALSGAWRWSLLISVWALAAAGILFKLFWFKAPRWLSTASYVAMGWIAAAAFYPLSMVLSLAGMLRLFGGGLLYSIGAVVYATKKPRISLQYFGFHEIFHLFVLAGSSIHYWMIFQIV